MKKLASIIWWKAATVRALRTALVLAIPYVPVSYLGDVPYVTLASAAGLGVILSYLTSLAGIAEADGTTQPWYYAIASRVIRTVAQALIAGVGTAVLITEVDWNSLWALALTSGFGSLLLAVLSQLPEADEPVAKTSITTVVTNNVGERVEQEIPVVAAVDVEGTSSTATADTSE